MNRMLHDKSGQISGRSQRWFRLAHVIKYIVRRYGVPLATKTQGLAALDIATRLLIVSDSLFSGSLTLNRWQVRSCRVYHFECLAEISLALRHAPLSESDFKTPDRIFALLALLYPVPKERDRSTRSTRTDMDDISWMSSSVMDDRAPRWHD